MAYKYAEILAAMAERAKVSDTPWDIVQWSICLQAGGER